MLSITYHPQQFSDEYAKTLGQKLWRFLTEEETIIRMGTATYLGRPAVEPLSPYLIQNFGDDVRRDRIKQMIGHMARQIMEDRGYTMDRNSVRITRKGNMFTSASRYKQASDSEVNTASPKPTRRVRIA